METVADGWQKIWVDLCSDNGQLVLSIGLLEGRNGNHVFKERGQEVIFGGFEIYEKRRQVTAISDLPLGSDSCQWDMIEGLNAEVTQECPVITGRPIMRLAAAGPEGRHALGACFGGLSAGRVFRAIAWVKGNISVMIEARDALDPYIAKPLNYGVARFDLAGRLVMDRGGDIVRCGMETASDGWRKIWVELCSDNGQLVTSIGLIEGRNGNHVFKERGQEVIFGGFEVHEKSEFRRNQVAA
jgi:hypothetical protein